MATKAATKQAPARDEQAAQARRSETLAANSGAIDFGAPVDAGALRTAEGGGPGRWQQRLDMLYQGVIEGKAKVGAFYKIGSFNSAAGAATTRKAVIDNPDKLVRGSFDLRTKIVRGSDGSKSSELYAAVTEVDESATADDGDWEDVTSDE